MTAQHSSLACPVTRQPIWGRLDHSLALCKQMHLQTQPRPTLLAEKANRQIRNLISGTSQGQAVSGLMLKQIQLALSGAHIRLKEERIAVRALRLMLAM